MIKIFTLIILMSAMLFANIGTIMALKGSASIQRNGSDINAKGGMSILNSDIIKTYNNSRIQIILKDNTTLTIGANSSFEFTKFYFDGTSNSSLHMKANRGFFRTVTGKIGKIAPKRFKLKTISAIIGVRGTDFSGDIMENREIIRCYSGAISVELDNGGIKDILSGMLIEITDKSVNIKRNMKNMPFEKVMYKSKLAPQRVSDITQRLVKPEDIPCKPYEVEEQ